MNYLRHYNLLIERARNRNITGYSERHHITPRCMGGGNEQKNIVVLTPEEHYVAHQLLVKIYPLVSGLAFAAIRQARNCKGNKLYGWLKRINAEEISRKSKGKKISSEHREAIRSSKIGKPRSAETRAKISASRIGIRLSDEHKAKLSAALTGRKRPPRSDEWSAKIAIKAMGNKRRLGKPHSPETRAKISASRIAMFSAKMELEHR